MRLLDLNFNSKKRYWLLESGHDPLISLSSEKVYESCLKKKKRTSYSDPL